jgi:DNA-binding HxlR family transcriptional regulator
MRRCPVSRTNPDRGFGRFNCPVEIPVQVLGGKWKLVLVYHLLAGPQRNGELHPSTGPPVASPGA